MTSPAPKHTPTLSVVKAIALRHIYLHMGSWPRIIEMLYWPMINMLVWGFTSLYIITHYSDAAITSRGMVAGVLLTEVMIRVCITMLLLFLEEIWSRNLGHLFASPMRLIDYMIGMILMACVRAFLSMVPAALVAAAIFNFSILEFGASLLAYIPMLALNSIWYGLLILAMLLRFGMSSEWLAWMATWLIVPLVAAYYPVDILPGALQLVSLSLPATHVFISAKSELAGHGFLMGEISISLILNIVFTILSIVVFWLSYRATKKRGGILQMAE